MGGGAVKVLSLISTPLPLLYPRRVSSFLRLSTAAFSSYSRVRVLSDSPRRGSSTFRSSRQIRTQCLSNETAFNGPIQFKPEAVGPAWPEWARLVQWLVDEGYVDRARATLDRSFGDDFVERRDLPEEFVNVAEALLLFARENPDLLRSLSKKEIGVVVDSVSPFLFKGGESSSRRLRSFLTGNSNDVPQTEKAETIDLVHFLLSYAYNADDNSTNVVSDASVKNMLVELATLRGTAHVSNSAEPNQKQPLLQQQDQLSKPPGQIISRKAGDWVCSKCNFMNFARNPECLECREPKPKRILTGAEWACPQCDFFNYGRNKSCLRCDCKRPGEIPLPSTSPTKTSTLEDILNKSTIEISSNASHKIGTSSNRYVPIKDPGVNDTVERILSREPSKASWESLANQRQEPGHVPFNPLPADMFSKSKATDTEDKSSPSDQEFPDMMPVRKGENRFIVSKKIDRSLTSPQYKRRIAMEQANISNSDFVPFVPFPPDYFAKKRANKLSEMGQGSEKKEETNTRGIEISSSNEANHSAQQTNKSEYSNGQATNGNSNFVPLPLDNFAKKESKLSETQHANEKTEENNNMEISGNSSNEASHSVQRRNTSEYSNSGFTNLYSNSQENSNSQSGSGDQVGTYSAQLSNHSGYNNNEHPYSKTSYSNSQDNWNKSLEGSAVKEPSPLDMSEEAKAERWFKRAAQIKDISELENIPDEDFPEIMPMRKGVNRFVVSKRKTPLERRLTSSQYRRNLPTIKPDQVEDKGLNWDKS